MFVFFLKENVKMTKHVPISQLQSKRNLLFDLKGFCGSISPISRG